MKAKVTGFAVIAFCFLSVVRETTPVRRKQSSISYNKRKPMKMKLILHTLILAVVCICIAPGTARAQSPTPSSGKKPNILVIFGDDVGQTNLSAYSFGLMGYRTPNIDRIAKEGMMFTDYYAEQSCTAGRSTFITGQCTLRTGLSKVGLPGATAGLQGRDVTIAQLLKPQGYATGQFG